MALSRGDTRGKKGLEGQGGREVEDELEICKGCRVLVGVGRGRGGAEIQRSQIN